MYFREDQAYIGLSVDGKTYGGSWKTFSGGGLSADSQKTRPGGMGREVDIGGPASREDITLEIQMSDIVATWVAELDSKAGTGKAIVSVNLLAPDRSASGKRFGPFTGGLKDVTPPDMGGGAAASMLRVVISCDELPAAGS